MSSIDYAELAGLKLYVSYIDTHYAKDNVEAQIVADFVKERIEYLNSKRKDT
jgi:hypothetical protein